MQTPFFPGAEHPLYGTSDHTLYGVNELNRAAAEAIAICLKEPTAGLKLELETEEDLSDMRKELLRLIDGDFREIQNSPEHGWWQVVLLNGAIIRVCPREG